MGAMNIARRQMVDCQILPNNVTDHRLIAALLEIPREIFVAPEQRGLAYAEAPLKIAAGRFMTEPTILARLIQTAEIRAADRVLLIGAGTGYAAALLARLASDIVAVEEDEALAAKARANLDMIGVKSVQLRAAKLAAGAADHAPYDAIIVDGSAEALPAAIPAQLAEGGRLVVVLRAADGASRAMIHRAFGGAVSALPVFDAHLPLLPGFERARGFQF